VNTEASFRQSIELARMMANFNFLQGKKVTYGQIERFLKKCFETGPMMIFSCPIENSETDQRKGTDTIRIAWNRRSYGGHYQKRDIDEVFNFISSDAKGESDWEAKTINAKDFIYFPMGETLTQRFYCLFERVTPIDDEVVSLFVNFMTNISKGWSRLDELKKVENLIYVDDVTGLYNQRKLLKDIDIAIERQKQVGEDFSILFIDIDHFKAVNDGHGHLVGTELLESMGELLKKTLRESDLIYRYGGDEFVMIIPDVGPKLGRIIGERVLDAVKREEFKLKDSFNEQKEKSFSLTVSIGVACYPLDAHSKEEILGIADKMMYEAKNSGRGRVCYTSDLLEQSEKEEVE